MQLTSGYPTNTPNSRESDTRSRDRRVRKIDQNGGVDKCTANARGYDWTVVTGVRYCQNEESALSNPLTVQIEVNSMCQDGSTLYVARCRSFINHRCQRSSLFCRLSYSHEFCSISRLSIFQETPASFFAPAAAYYPSKSSVRFTYHLYSKGDRYEHVLIIGSRDEEIKLAPTTAHLRGSVNTVSCSEGKEACAPAEIHGNCRARPSEPERTDD